MRSGPPSPAILSPGDFLGRLERRIAIGGVRLSQWTANGPEAHGSHGHDEPHFAFVTSGDYLTRAEGEEGPFGTTLIYNPAGVVHDDRLVGGVGSFVAISLDPRLVRGSRRDPQVRAPRRLGGVRPQMAARRIVCALRAGDSVRIEDLCLDLLALTLETEGEAAPSRWLAEARQALSDPFAPTPSIQALGARLGVHPTYLARSFVRAYGCTPGEFSRSVRLSAAARLITRGHDGIGEIAARCGFADQSHLTNQLRRAYGVAPGELRRRTALAA
jgi:AraC family transcriptional regulator